MTVPVLLTSGAMLPCSWNPAKHHHIQCPLLNLLFEVFWKNSRDELLLAPSTLLVEQVEKLEHTAYIQLE